MVRAGERGHPNGLGQSRSSQLLISPSPPDLVMFGASQLGAGGSQEVSFWQFVVIEDESALKRQAGTIGYLLQKDRRTPPSSLLSICLVSSTAVPVRNKDSRSLVGIRIIRRFSHRRQTAHQFRRGSGKLRIAIDETWPLFLISVNIGRWQLDVVCGKRRLELSIGDMCRVPLEEEP